MLSIGLKVLLIVIIVLLSVFVFYFLFKHKPRKKSTHAKRSYEIGIILLGAIIIILSALAMKNEQFFWHFLFVLIAGVYISFTHIVSNAVGRYS